MQQSAKSSEFLLGLFGALVLLFGALLCLFGVLGMMLLGVDFLYGVAISASIGVLLVMLASLTLLPALLTMAGARVAAGGRRARRRARAAEHSETDAATSASAAPSGAIAAGRTWLRWSAFVHRRPRTIATLAAVLMLAIAAPATPRLCTCRISWRLAGPGIIKTYMMKLGTHT